MGKQKDTASQTAGMIKDGLILESIYFKDQEETKLLIWDKKAITMVDSYKDNEKILVPVAANKTILQGSVILPPPVVPYGDSEMKLFGDIKDYIHKYVDISEDFEVIAVLYTLMGWVYEDFHTVPYLRVIGDFGSGKTRFLKVLGSISFRGIIASGGTTTAPIFRLLNKYRGTLVLDEADYQKSDKTSDLVKILNSGYERGMTISRCNPNDYEDIESFQVFGPKIIASRELFQDQALESRFINYGMLKLDIRNDIPRSLDDSFYDESEALRGKLLSYRLKNLGSLQMSTELIPGLHARVQQIMQPLLAVALSEEQKEVIRKYAQQINRTLMSSRGVSWDADVVSAIAEMIQEGSKKVKVGDIATRVSMSSGEGESIKPKHVGNICRKKLQLYPVRIAIGCVIDFGIPENMERLEFWKKNLGVTVNKVNMVNIGDDDVNPENVPWPDGTF